MKIRGYNFLFAALATMAVASGVSAQAAPATPPNKTTFVADLGFVSATGNTELTTLSVDDKLIHTAGRWTLSQLGAYVYGKTRGLETANQLLFAGRADYALQPRLTVFGGASFERNPFAGFRRRTDEIAGLSFMVLNGPTDFLSLDGGGVLTQESDVDGTHKSFPAARFAGAYKHLFSKTAYFQQLAEYLPNLQTSGEYRVNTESSIVAPVSAHIGLKAAYAVRYDSRPPAGFGSTDRLLTTSVQISY
jgi:putative salt-induced outer membrane protein